MIFTVLTQNPLPSALLCYLAEIPLRLAHSRENPYQLLTDWVADTETLASARHEVTRQLDLVAHVGATTEDCRLSLRISSSVQYATERWLERHELSPRGSWCILHPGASAASRMYPAESYAQVAEQLARLGWRVVVTGSMKEAGLAECISRTCPQAINLAGCLDVEQLASLIAHCPVLICGNTGPAHLAAATGTPVVDLYALTNPQHTPWLGPSRVLNVDVPCRNCLKSVCPEGHHHCLRLVRPEQIVQAAIELTEACFSAGRHPTSELSMYTLGINAAYHDPQPPWSKMDRCSRPRKKNASPDQTWQATAAIFNLGNCRSTPSTTA